MLKVKAVIFDLDGVLIDSLPFHYRTLRKLFGNMRIEYTFEEYIKNDITAGVMNLIPRVLKEHNRRGNVRTLVSKKNRMVKNESIRLNSGVLNLLKSLKKNGYKIAVTSGHKVFCHACAEEEQN